MKKIMLMISVIALLLISACAQEEPEQPVPEDPGVPEDEPLDPFEGDFEEPEMNLPDVVATVNGEEIRSEDVYNFQAQMEMQGSQIMEEDAINSLIGRVILLQEAESRDYEVSKEDIKEALALEGITQEMVEMQGIAYDEFIEEQVRFEKLGMLQEEKMESIEVTEEEAKELYDQQAGQMEESFEELKEFLKEVIAGQQADILLQNLITELEETAVIETFY